MRPRSILRGSLALLVAGPALVFVACGPDGSTGGPGLDAGGSDSSVQDRDAPSGDGPVAPVDAADAADGGFCVDDFDAAPVVCGLPRGDQPCPARPGVCGSDGRTYCSAAHAAAAGIAVVLGVACDLPCGLLADGGPYACDAVTEYCASQTDILYRSFTCGTFAQSGCAADHSCACLKADSSRRITSCTEKNGAVYVVRPGSPTVRRPHEAPPTE